ncbi:hypothetical protein Tco_0440069, partial [Tanacetum coccineum]
DVVSTISGEYLLEFTSEYGIPEGLHPELPGLEDTIMDFLEGKVEMDLFNLISASNPAKVKTGTRPRIAHEVPLLTAIVSRVIEMEDPVATSTSSVTPSIMKNSPLDFSSEDPPPMITNKGETEDQTPVVASQEVSSAKNTVTAGVIPELNLEKETIAKEPPDTRRGKSLVAIGLGPEPPFHTSVRQSVSNPDPLSYAEPRPIPKQDVAQYSKIAAVVADPDSENTSFTCMAGSLGSIYQPGWGVTNGCRLDTPGACQYLVDHIAPLGYFSELRHLPNDDFLSQYNINLARQVAMGSQLRLRENEIKNLEALLEAEADMKKAAEAKNAKLVEELEGLRAQFSDLQVSNDQLSQQVSTLQAQITGEEKIKAAFEEFKKYEDEQVNSRCAEMDVQLDKLSIDFDEELYPHMLTAIAGRHWVIGYGLRLAIMRCVESSEIRRAFADVVSRDLPKANSKLIKAPQDLKDLNYLMVDQLEKLRDALMELIMTSLHLESATREDTPQWIRDLRPSTSQEKIPIYPLAEKKKKYRVVCRTHGVSSAHHARSDSIPVSALTVAPQGPAILLADASTQTKISEGKASPRLLRSMSLPAMYNLDWP